MKKPYLLLTVLLLVILLFSAGCINADKNNTQNPNDGSICMEFDTEDNFGTESNDLNTEQDALKQDYNEQILLDSFVDTGDAKLNELCDSVLKKILKSNMSDKDKAYAIYQWVSKNVDYRGSSDTSDWVAGAKHALTYKKGNCYAFYSASRGLLTRAGFENVEAVFANRSHYWNIVKVDGVWRHFDTTDGWGTTRFLWTGTQINEYKYFNEKYGKYITYEWDPTGCPNTD